MKKSTLKTKELKNTIKEIITLDTKHKLIINLINDKKKNKDILLGKINKINDEIKLLKINEQVNIKEIVILLNSIRNMKDELTILESDYNELDYYDITGDLLMNYYELKNNKENDHKEKINILDFFSNEKNNNNKLQDNTKTILLDKFSKRIDNYKLINNNFSNRIKYCNECIIEKILDISESAYICPCCGDTENIIIDDDKQIKEYSPYRRLNHFREWLNQFQAKQTPEISEQIFIDIVKELNKNRVTNLSLLNKKNMKTILKKLNYNIYYEHTAYIINKLNNLPPPKITRDMEKIFISMFLEIQEPWEKYKISTRKNFLSYSYVLHKFCELLELDHLLDCFPLLKDPDKIMENDDIWEKICKHLNWEYISSFK